MATPYQNTISGLLKRRAELMADACELRERMVVGASWMAAAPRKIRGFLRLLNTPHHWDWPGGPRQPNPAAYLPSMV